VEEQLVLQTNVTQLINMLAEIYFMKLWLAIKHKYVRQTSKGKK